MTQTNEKHIAMVYYNLDKPLYIGYIADCIRKREEQEPNPYLPHTLKIKTLVKPKPFIDLL
jgi:hypothetical protein